MKKIKTKLMLGILVVFLISFIVFALNISSNQLVVHKSQSLLKDNYPSIKNAYLMLKTLDTYHNTLIKHNKEDSIDANAFNKDLDAFKQEFDSYIEIQNNIITEKGEAQITKTLNEGFKKYITSINNTEYTGNFEVYNEKYSNLRSSIISIYDLNIAILEKKNIEIQNSTVRILNIQEKVGIFGLTILCILIVLLPFYLINPINKLSTRMQNFYKENFNEDIEIESNHELEKLEEIFEKIVLKQTQNKEK